MTPTPRRAAIVVVGCSLGGLDALRRLLGGLPAGFPLPVAIVQHRAPDGGPLALLAAVSALPVFEPADKQPLEPGVVYLATVWGPMDPWMRIAGVCGPLQGGSTGGSATTRS